jgi:hypothetical protein
MKKLLLTAVMALVTGMGLTKAQSFLNHTTYRGAFAPAPAVPWTAGWTEWDPQNKVYPANTMTITSLSGTNNAIPTITSNTTWNSTDVVYLNGPIFVKGCTLTIMPGCVVKGAPGNGSGLFICTGAKLMAAGTASQPIVFTSNSAPGFRNAGDWGGVILLGLAACNAPANNTANVTPPAPNPVAGTNYIEGMPSTSLTLYGGGSNPCNDDNSGVMTYCRIEFAGYVYAPNKEINGLTFGAIGYGTTIDYIQVSYSNDDSYEWFGGSVRCKHMISFAPIDDEWDTDNGFTGIVQYGLGIRHPSIYDPTWNVAGGSVSEGFESDNDPEDLTISGYAAGQPHAQTAAIFANMTEIGPRGLAAAMSLSVGPGHMRNARIRRNSSLRIVNSIMVDAATNGVFTDGLHSTDNAVNGCMVVKSNIIAGYASTSIKTNNGGTAGTWTLAPNQTNWIGSNNDTSAVNMGSVYIANPYTVFTGTNADFRPIGTATAGADWSNVHISGEDVNYPCDQSTYTALAAYVATCTAAPSSVKENKGNIAAVSLYPNPTFGNTILKIDAQSASVITVNITDITGKVISTPVLNQNLLSGENEIKINTSELNSGIYFITLTTGQSKETVKLMVNK